MKRKIVKILAERCNGCGLCIPNCPEGAIRIVEGKAKLVKESLCDGLGACLGQCPEGAILIEERESEAYSEAEAMSRISSEGPLAVESHLDHLRDHGEEENLKIALRILHEKEVAGTSGYQSVQPTAYHEFSGCPGTASRMLRPVAAGNGSDESNAVRTSSLTHWPIQLHLISPQAPHYRKRDLLLAADCVAFSVGDFHKDYLHGRVLAIACPKLDAGQEIYREKLTALIDGALLNTLTVMTMEVPCCNGLLRLAQQSVERAGRKIPIRHIQVSLDGGVLCDEWLQVNI